MTTTYCPCGNSYESESYRVHRRLPHFSCCGDVFFGVKWRAHQRTTGHSGEKVLLHKQKRQQSTWKDEVACELGCGSTLKRFRMPKHLVAKHFRCTSCHQIFLFYGKRRHENETAHVSYEDVAIPEGDFNQCIRTEPAVQTPGDENLLSGVMRKKYEGMIQCLLQELRNQFQGLSEHTRWHQNMELLRKIFPQGQDIPFARIETLSSPRTNVDVYYTTEKEMESLINEGFTLRKPIVIRSKRQQISNNALDQFLEQLGDHLQSTALDVQDFSTTNKNPVRMPVDVVINRIKDGDSISNGRLPINLLSLKFLGQASPAPAFLNQPRFGLIPAITSRLEGEFARKKLTGKQSRSTSTTTREADLIESMTFSIFAQRGCFTGFHVDNPDGTWLCSLWGLKVWIFPSAICQTDMTSFEEQGDAWKPETVAVIVLEPGDILIMPPAEFTPHAVLTLKDSHMVGGMFLDVQRILDSIEKLLWIAKHLRVTNERIPLQLISG